MDLKTELIKTVDYLRSKTGLTQKEISLKAGYDNEHRITQAISRETGQKPVIKKLRIAFKEELQNVTFSDNADTAPARRPVKAKKEEVKQPEQEPDMSIQALYKLANANEMLAYSNKELTVMLKQERKSVGFPEEIVEAFGSTIQNLQDVVMEVALGKRFHDKKEVAAALTGKAETSIVG